MKEFTFPLESLRVLRKQKERAAQQRYAKALAACKRAETQLVDAAIELESGQHLFGNELNKGITAGHLASLRNGCLVLEIRWRERQAALIEARRVAGLIFREMAVATREREGLDQFHDKARNTYEHNVRRTEQKVFDELATQANGRNSLFQSAGRGNE
ncbi:MAG: flagellar export protein FliJ [Verrucomicrobiota bacterium]|jgi:flagellar export protein FliJ